MSSPLKLIVSYAYVHLLIKFQVVSTEMLRIRIGKFALKSKENIGVKTGIGKTRNRMWQRALNYRLNRVQSFRPLLIFFRVNKIQVTSSLQIILQLSKYRWCHQIKTLKKTHRMQLTVRACNSNKKQSAGINVIK